MDTKKDYIKLILELVQEPDITPVKVSYLYKRAIKQNKYNNSFEKVNNAIVDKWDFTTLEHIKNLAWRTRRNNIGNRLIKLLGVL